MAHEPAWPDKTMFASLTLVIAGLLTMAFAGLQLLSASVAEVSGFMEDISPYYTLGAGLATAALGLLALRSQAAVWVALGALAAIVSLGFYGVAPVLGLTSLVFLALGWREGEEMKRDEHTVAAHLWPDKALAASLFLFVAGVVALFQAGYVLAGRLDVLLPDAVIAPTSIAFGVFLLWSSRQCFRLRRAWAARTGALLAIASLAFYVIGPLLGIVALVLLGLADREREFAGTPAA